MNKLVSINYVFIKNFKNKYIKYQMNKLFYV